MELQEFKIFSKKDGVHWVYIYFVDGEPTNATLKYIDNDYFRASKESILNFTSNTMRTVFNYDVSNHVLPNISPLHVVDIARSFPHFEWKVECDDCDKTLLVENVFMTDYKGAGGVSYEPTSILCDDCIYERIIVSYAEDLSRYAGFEYGDDVYDWYEYFQEILTPEIIEYLWVESFEMGDYQENSETSETVLDYYKKTECLPDYSEATIEHFIWMLTAQCDWHDLEEDNKCLKVILPTVVQLVGKPTDPFAKLEQTIGEKNMTKNLWGDNMDACDHCAGRHKNDYNPDQMKFDFWVLR